VEDRKHADGAADEALFCRLAAERRRGEVPGDGEDIASRIDGALATLRAAGQDSA
jgi:hypothetical protein